MVLLDHEAADFLLQVQVDNDFDQLSCLNDEEEDIGLPRRTWGEPSACPLGLEVRQKNRFGLLDVSRTGASVLGARSHVRRKRNSQALAPRSV